VTLGKPGLSSSSPSCSRFTAACLQQARHKVGVKHVLQRVQTAVQLYGARHWRDLLGPSARTCVPSSVGCMPSVTMSGVRRPNVVLYQM